MSQNWPAGWGAWGRTATLALLRMLYLMLLMPQYTIHPCQLNLCAGLGGDCGGGRDAGSAAHAVPGAVAAAGLLRQLRAQLRVVRTQASMPCPGMRGSKNIMLV